VISAREVTRICRECYRQRDVLQFDSTVTDGKHGRRRYCLVCRPNGIPWPQVATFSLPDPASPGIATPSVADRLAVILACWDSCREEGPAAMARLLDQLWEVSYKADAVLAGRLCNVVSQARAGAVSLEFARRQVEGMG